MRAVALGLLAMLAPVAGTAGDAVPADAPPLVVVELFTSQGCSSCPPADRLLAELQDEAHVVGISQHVAYWNDLGWRDPFSDAAFDERQRRYAEIVGDGRVYTPQMVVDGRVAFVGSRREIALEQIRRAAARPHAELSLALDGDTLRVAVGELPRPARDQAHEIVLAIVEDRVLVDVPVGENAGRRLGHVGVARSLSTIGRIPRAKDSGDARVELDLDPAWNRSSLRAVVWVQSRRDAAIYGAAALSLSAGDR